MLRHLTALGFGLPTPGTAFSRLAHGAAGSFGLKLANMALVYAATLLLARLLGADGYGAYAFALAWVNLLIIPALFGMETLALREVARGQALGEHALIRGTVQFTSRVALAVALVISVAVYLALWVVPRWPSPELNSALRAGIWLLPLLAGTRVLSASVRGLQRIVLAQIPVLLVIPFVLLLALVVVVVLGRGLDFEKALWLHISAAAVGLVSAAAIWARSWPQRLFRRQAHLRTRAWLASALAFMLIGSSYVINLEMDRVMLGSMMGAEAVGIYAIAARNAALVELFMLAVNMALAPYVAERFAKEDLRQLQSTVTSVARIVVVCTIPAALLMIALSPHLLALFGPAFVQGESVLIVLVVGYVLAVLAGSAGTILSMTGHEKNVVLVLALSVATNVGLNLLLIPRYGMLGAAAATFVSNLLWRVTVAYQALRLLGLDSTPFGVFASRCR